MTADPAVVYGTSREGLRFAVVDALHPVGHHGQDYRLPAGGGSEVVAYEECVVVECGVEVTRGFTSMLGWYLVARAKSDGRYIGWAHLRRGTRAALGATLKPGDRVGLAASGPVPKVALGPLEAGIDYPGTAWAGAHIHTTDSNTIPGIFAGNTVDPLPRIHAALARLSGASSGGTTPINVPGTTPVPIKEADMLPDERDALFHLRDAADQIRDYLGANGGSNTATDKTIGHQIGALAAGLAALPVPPTPAANAKAAWWEQTVERANADGTVSKIPAIQELADIKTTVLALSATGGIDVDKLADAIAAKIPGTSVDDIRAAVKAELAALVLTPKA